MSTVDQQIQSAADAISSNIATLSHDRALLAQNILSQLRNLVEGVAVRVHAASGDVEFDYTLVGAALAHVSARAKLNFLKRFHKLLQISTSHYTMGRDPSERLMLKYYDYLHRIRDLASVQLNLNILANLEAFPVDLDPSLREYHEKIAERIVAARALATPARKDRYYIHSVRPFYTGGHIYYEVTFYNAVNRANKVDRVIGFTDIDITDRYAANLTLQTDSIQVLGQTMPITIVREWEVSIRPCEFDNFARIFHQRLKTSTASAEYRNLMQYLTKTSSSLLDIVDMEGAQYDSLKAWAAKKSQQPRIFPVLDLARQNIQAKAAGHNVLRYLMLRMNNEIIKLQYASSPCGVLSNLGLEYGCKPFDRMPFCTSLCGHNPRFTDLAESLDITGRTHELLARRVKTNVEDRGMLSGIKRSSQQLEIEELRWMRRSVPAVTELCVRRCGHLGGRRWPGVSIGSGSGAPSRRGYRPKKPHRSPVSRLPSDHAGSVKLAACEQSPMLRCLDAICRSPSARKSRSCTLRAMACAISLAN